MAHGYELKLTPLQLLSFYNTVANDGKQMKPYLVSEIQEYGEELERFYPTVVRRKIASDRTVKRAQDLLLGVVEKGTARKLKTEAYKFSGKTGTAQLNYKRSGEINRVGGYQSSFVGYFPAEAPEYSCIVMIYKPRKGGYYGSDVALPVFREIADNVFSLKPELLNTMNEAVAFKPIDRNMPVGSVGKKSDFIVLSSMMDLNYEELSSSPWTYLDAQSDTLQMERKTIKEGIVPSVVGMGLRDAVYLLETMGLKVSSKGYGKVVNQSIIPGTRVVGQQINLRLQ